MPVTAACKDRDLTARLSGEIDHHGARTMMAELDQIIAQRLPRRLTLDLSGVNFMDSSGIAVIIRCKRRMDELGGSLRAVSIPTQPRRVLDAAGVGRLIPLE